MLMQLFITEYRKENTLVTITEERVIHQLKNVLRATWSFKYMVQKIQWYYIERLTLELKEITKEYVIATCIDEKVFDIVDNKKHLCIALPNKIEKMELIVQKCTEIWIQHITFFVSQYSQIHDISEHKLQRLWKIALEAAEQSYWLFTPNIICIKKIDEYIKEWRTIIFHQDGEYIKNISKNILIEKNTSLFFLIWPEWWRWSHDEKIFLTWSTTKVSLWKNILRTETASILAAWEAVNRASI